METIVTQKVGMTQMYTEQGKLVPVTLVLLKDTKELSLEEGKKVKIVGVSKGKGFQGAVKRHGFAGAPKSHGHKHDLRKVGSIGGGFPERVVKGRRMPGRMGNQQVTIKNLLLVKIDKEHNLLALKGALPGPNGSKVKIMVDLPL